MVGIMLDFFKKMRETSKKPRENMIDFSMGQNQH